MYYCICVYVKSILKVQNYYTIDNINMYICRFLILKCIL